MMSWRGNEDSPKPQRPADIVGANEAMGLTVSSKKKRRKAKAEAEAIARQSRMTPADRFAPAKRMEREPKDTQHFVPDIVEDAREGARDGREAKRERIHADLERRIANKPPTDPVRIARARGES
jgi:F0F1-type ATP synthase membrane subunit b/b'